MNLANGKKVFTLEYYQTGFSGWGRSSRVLWIIGILIQLSIGFYSGFSLLSLTSTFAGIIGFTCTLAITNGKSINGLLGFISALMLVYVALKTHNYSDIVMQLAYIILLDLPIVFSNSWNEQELEVRKLKVKGIIGFVGIFIVFFIACYLLDTKILHSPQAFLDAFSASIGLTGAVLCVQRYRAQYYLWTLQSLISIMLWIQTAINGHPVWVLMITYMLYISNNIVAFADSKWFTKKSEMIVK